MIGFVDARWIHVGADVGLVAVSRHNNELQRSRLMSHRQKELFTANERQRITRRM